MKAASIAILTTLSALILVSTFIVPTYAITGNYEPDSTPYVGIVVLFSDTARQQPIGYCTGILISPTVVLTAGHGTIEAAAASVCFDQGPISYSVENGQLVYSGSYTVYDGTPITYPEYAQSLAAGATNGNQFLSTSDVGVIILDKPVESVTSFPTLPQAGFDDMLPARTTLQVIGYGVQYQVVPKNNGILASWSGTVSRNTAQVQLLSTNFQGSNDYLKCSANPSQNKGGIAFGDSGGPVLYTTGDSSQTVIVAINSYVTNSNCAGVTYHTRIDTSQVLTWINGFTN